MRSARRPRSRRGITLLEVMVAVGVLAMCGALVYGAFDGLSKSQRAVTAQSERFHQGRAAMARMAREIQSAFLSLHRPYENPGLQTSLTAFVGTDGGRFDRLDFTSFSHRRLGFGAHESDQNEISYFLSPDRSSGLTDLARREATVIDMEPRTGGVVQVLAYDVQSFELSYYDPVTSSWKDSWDTTRASGELERLPRHVRVELVVNHHADGAPHRFVTKVPLSMQAPLIFGLAQ
jgi:general secretion pathway protein J